MKKNRKELLLIKILLKEKDNLSKLSSFSDLQKLDSYLLHLLIKLETSILDNSEDEYSEYASGGHHRDGLYILEKATDPTVNAEDIQDSICLSLEYVQYITAISSVLHYDDFAINKLKKNTDTFFSGFKYQAIVIDGCSHYQNWLALKTINCSPHDFLIALKEYANSFNIEHEHQCFLGFYTSSIETNEILFLNLDFMDFDFLRNSVLSIPQECIFNKKIKTSLKSML